MKNVVAIVCIVLLGIVMSCASQTNGSGAVSASAYTSTNTNVYEAEAGNALPAECQSPPDRENLTDGAQTTLVVKCSCTSGSRTAIWYNAVRSDLDPVDYCHPGYPVFYEGTATETVTVVPVDAGSAATALPPMPTVLPVQLPASDAGAKPDATATTQVTLMYRDVRYSCQNGIATRDYKSVNQSSGHETVQETHQQCVGQGFSCLTDVTEQRDPSKPPCGCTGNRRITLLSAAHNTWACYDQTPNPRASASADAGSHRP